MRISVIVLYLCIKMTIMDKLLKNKAVVLYICNELKECDYYRLFKILYFAEQKHLSKYGDKIVEDDFYALPHGPVPTLIYDEIKKLKKQTTFSSLSGSCTLIHGEILVPKEKPNLDFLSESEIECLSESINENKDLTFVALKKKSHQSAWKLAKGKKISTVEIAKEANTNDDMIKYIEFIMDNRKSA